MSGRPATGPAPPALRLEVLKELQQLIDNREARDRIDSGPIGEMKGRNHWVFHLLLRAQESAQAHTDRLIGSAYANVLARVQAIEDRVATGQEIDGSTRNEVVGKLDGLSTSIGEKIDRGLADGTERISDAVAARFTHELDERWRPIGESIEVFAVGSKQMLKDVADTYKVATQTRLLLNENARRVAELGKDLLSLEESLKLVVQRTIEATIAPLEERVAQLEAHAGIVPPPPSAPAAGRSESSSPNP
jgi:hypothetical protein